MVINSESKISSDDHVRTSTVKKLEKEINQLSALRDILKRSNQVASSVETILDSFDHRLGRLEQTILPLYQQTENLQRRQKNTEKTLQALDFVIDYYNVAGEMEGVIKERPSSVGLREYIRAMDRLNKACTFFETNNPQASELENVKSLFEDGCQQLSIEFRDELKKYQKPLAPTVVLDLIEVEESELNDEVLSSIGFIPANVRRDLKLIAGWLDTHSSYDRLTVFGKQRAFVLSESLRLLRVYQRSNSGEKGSSFPLSPTQAVASPAARIGTKLDATRLRAAKISHKATRAIFRAMPVQSTSKWQGTSVKSEDTLDEREVAVHVNQVSALHRLTLCELMLARQLIPREKLNRIFELIVKDAVHEVIAEAENMASQAHKSVSKGDIQAIHSLLALLQHMTVLCPQFDSLFDFCQPSVKAQFSTILKTLQETTGNALEAFVVNIRSEGDRCLPKDGTVHELTSNSLVFLEHLLDFSSYLGPILLKEGPNPEIAKNPKGHLVSLGFYIKKVLSYLGFSLVHRSSNYSDPNLCAVFRLNNYNYILKTLHSSDLMTVVSLAEPHCARNYRGLILEQKEIYNESIKKLLIHLEIPTDLSVAAAQDSKMRDKDKQLIKDKFSGFNKDLEELQRAQRAFSIPDLELRESIKRDNKELVLPKYQVFYDKFSQLQFSKSSTKYVKYSPVDVSLKLDEFFDAAA